MKEARTLPGCISRKIRVGLVGPFGRRFLLSAMVGAGAGLGAVVFYFLLQATLGFVQKGVIGYVPPEVIGEPSRVHLVPVTYRPWLFFLVPAVGALVSGLLVWWLAPEAAGHGTDAAIEAYHCRDGEIRAVVPIVKAVTAAITIGSGGSGGREGPIAQIGAGIGAWIGRRLDLEGRERRILMAAGMGAGVGAIFRAPLAGAIFAGEILYGSSEIEPEVLVPALLASIVAYSCFGLVHGWDPLFRVPEAGFEKPAALVLYAVLAVIVALAGMVFVSVFYGIHAVFDRFPVPRPAVAATGGLLTGVVAYFHPGSGFTGYGDVQEALLGHHSAGPLLMLAGLRILTTSFSIGSGGSGGVFGPSMVIGGCLGGAVGMFFNAAWPDLVPDPAPFVVVGMAGFFGGIAHAPISTVIMVSEMTGSYRLLVPSMWVSSLTFLMCGRVFLYRKQVHGREDSPAHRQKFSRDFLQELSVGAYMTRVVMALREERGIEDQDDILDTCPHRRLPVVDADGRPVGIASADELRLLRQDPVDPANGPVARFMDEEFQVVTPERSLSEAARLLSRAGTPILLVVDRAQAGRMVGVLTRADILDARQRAMETGR